MAFVPRVSAVEPGKVQIATAIKLPSGKLRRDAVWLDADNLAAFADALDSWNVSRAPEGSFRQGADSVAFVYGGSEWEPRVIVVNHGPYRGSMSMSAEDVPIVVRAVREAARRGVGRS